MITTTDIREISSVTVTRSFYAIKSKSNCIYRHATPTSCPSTWPLIFFSIIIIIEPDFTNAVIKVTKTWSISHFRLSYVKSPEWGKAPQRNKNRLFKITFFLLLDGQGETRKLMRNEMNWGLWGLEGFGFSREMVCY